jgi:hypothetical protein
MAVRTATNSAPGFSIILPMYVYHVRCGQRGLISSDVSGSFWQRCTARRNSSSLDAKTKRRSVRTLTDGGCFMAAQSLRRGAHRAARQVRTLRLASYLSGRYDRWRKMAQAILERSHQVSTRYRYRTCLPPVRCSAVFGLRVLVRNVAVDSPNKRVSFDDG